MNKRIDSWSEYWQKYNSLCDIIRSENNQLAEQLIDAKLYVNGLTDGWHDFLNVFKELIFKNAETLSLDCKVQADILITQLEKSLMSQTEYGGMTVNERLVIANKMDEFDNAIIEFFKMLLNISESSAGYIFERDKKTMLQKVHQLDEIGKNLGYQLLRGKIKNPFSQYGRLDSIGLLQTKILELMGEGYSFIQIMEEYLSPENNGFKLGNIFDIPSDDIHEIWFEGSYLMIPSIPLMYYLNGIRI